MRILPGIGLLMAMCSTQAGAQPADADAVLYDVRFDNAVHHEANISVTYRKVGRAPLRVQMSRSSPGRYAIHEFGKNVYSVSAKDGAGRPLKLTRTDPYGWTVPGHDGTVTISYTLFADRADGTYSQIDATHAHLNMPATFMWATGFDDRPITIRFRPYDSKWKVATQLPAAGQAYTYRAPNLQYFMDSPTELSDHLLREWPVSDKDGRYTIRLALHHQGSAADADRFAEMARKVTEQQIAMFRDVPNFDFGTYTFLADYLPHVSGDGMEHRNSTYLTSSSSLREEEFKQIGTLSHEFFHAWNVERLRPAELEPFDFTRANPTPSLWLAEGFTSYYGPLMIRRAGLSSVDEYLAGLSGEYNYVFNRTGRRYGSPQEMSLRAPFVDAAQSIDPTNPNIFSSYYVYGSIIAAALDLSLRQQFRQLSLDDYMRHLWKVHGVPERTYRPDDLRLRLAELTKSPAFADSFFSRTIEGNELPNFEPLFAHAGLKLRIKNPSAAFAGSATLAAEGTKVTVTRTTVPQTPLYEAGVDSGDEIVSLGGVPIDSVAGWSEAVARHAPGGETELRFIQRGVEKSAKIRFIADPTAEIVRYEAAGQQPTSAQLAFRQEWLGSEAAPSK